MNTRQPQAEVAPESEDGVIGTGGSHSTQRHVRPLRELHIDKSTYQQVINSHLVVMQRLGAEVGSRP